MTPEIFHENVMGDIIEALRTGIEGGDRLLLRSNTKRSIFNASSVTKVASDLTMVTPVGVSSAVSRDAALMITKALERRNVAIYQMLFSAYSITNASDGVSHLQQFHTNLDVDKMNLDRFMDMMDSIEESTKYSYVSQSDIAYIAEQCRARLNVVPEDDINKSSLMGYKQIQSYSGPRVIAVQEVRDGYPEYHNSNVLPDPSDYYYPGDDKFGDALNLQNAADRRETEMGKAEREMLARQQQDRQNKAQNKIAGERLSFEIGKSKIDKKHRGDLFDYQKKRDKESDEYARQRDDVRDTQYYQKMRQSGSQQRGNAIQNMLLPSDVKKANEMQPSLMVVNFYYCDEDRDMGIAEQFVCGVKSKLYLVDSDLMCNKIITKTADADVLLSLIKVSTGEISFAKDFLLAIDNAKIDALSKSKKKSGSALFRALEKRSLNSKIRKSLRANNCYKNVAALVISMEEVDQIRKYNNIDVMDPKVIVPMMDKFALLYFVVVDEVSEAVYLMISGSYDYEVYSFTSLEREGGDANYKKIVNLMTKLNR